MYVCMYVYNWIRILQFRIRLYEIIADVKKITKCLLLSEFKTIISKQFFTYLISICSYNLLFDIRDNLYSVLVNHW